jgi:hypothetical protein
MTGQATDLDRSQGRSFAMARDDLELISYAVERLLGRIGDLGDEEHLWEPVDDCWNVRFVDGAWVGDVAPDGTHYALQVPPPFTTIAWRLWHLGASPLPTWPTGQSSGEEFVRAYFNQIPMSQSPAVGTAEEARTLVAATWERMVDTFAGFTAEELSGPMGSAAGPFREATLAGLVLHVADELIHHSAEVGVLRDLYVRQGAG